MRITLLQTISGHWKRCQQKREKLALEKSKRHTITFMFDSMRAAKKQKMNEENENDSDSDNSSSSDTSV